MNHPYRVLESTRETAAAAAVVAAGRSAAARQWVPATSGNFSVRIDAERIAITRSGLDKGDLQIADVLIQPLRGPLLAGSSAEAPLHLRLYQDDPRIGAIFHTHSVAAAVIGRAGLSVGSLRVTGWELQKALSGVASHEAVIDLPIFENDQDTTALACRIAARLAEPAAEGIHRAPGYLLSGHGLYAWGHNSVEASRHLEALETILAQTIAFKAFDR